MRPLLLASTSPYRRILLERLALPFVVVAPQVIEADDAAEPAAEPAAARAARLARAKAEAVAHEYPDAIVIGSDQVASLQARVLHKPGNALRAREQLTQLSGNTACFHTACTVIGTSAHVDVSHVDRSDVVFRSLVADEIERYIVRDRPFDCAGSFKAEALGITLFTRIDSHDPTALIGLPLIWLAHALRGCGYSLP